MSDEFEDGIDWFLFCLDEEREHRGAIDAITDQEWLAMFPEAVASLPAILKEREDAAAALKETIKSKMQAAIGVDPVEAYRVRLSVLINEVQELTKTLQDVARLKRQIAFGANKTPVKGIVTVAEIETAQWVPISSLLPGKGEQRGKRLWYRCPLHKENTPSFAVYVDENRYHCFGCDAHGDSITLIRRLHNLGFVEAVKRLNSYV